MKYRKEIVMKIINDFTEEEFHEMLMREGIEKGIEQTVRSMLADKLPIEKIVLYTGYDVEKIERIKKEIVGV